MYGDWPTFPGQPQSAARKFYNGIGFRIGHVATTANVPGVRIPPERDFKRDLPRSNKKAQIADASPACLRSNAQTIHE